MSIRPFSSVLALTFLAVAVVQLTVPAPTASYSVQPRIHLSTRGIVGLSIGIPIGVCCIVLASYFCCCHAACMRAKKLKGRDGQAQWEQTQWEEDTARGSVEKDRHNDEFDSPNGRSLPTAEVNWEGGSASVVDVSANKKGEVDEKRGESTDEDLRPTVTRSDAPPEYEAFGM
ncbi:hypothetical protein B0H17DRAFT_1078249, partial [Mycena rosella]